VKRARRLLVILVAVGALAYVFSTPLLTAIGQYLIDDEPPERADVIVVLAGSVPDRILEAVALYKDGFAPRVVVSKAPNPPGYGRLTALGISVPLQSDLNRSIAVQLGVPDAAIAVVGVAAHSTIDEGAQILRYAAAHGYRTLLVVTSKPHTRRAAMIYRYLAGSSFRIISRPARDDEFEPSRWWRNRTFRRRLVFEYQKLAAFFLFDRWRFPPLVLDPAGQKHAA
jgi:uncharacterized SAM-binding protein YcdF (DUF218 family)